MTNDIELSDVLASNYMLASLTVRCWSAKRTDRAAANKLMQDAGATNRKAANVVKSLFAGCDGELDATQKAYGRIRQWFYDNSLPWSADDHGNGVGDRLIGTVQAMEFLRGFAELKTEAEAKRDEFVAVYDTAVQRAAQTMGSLYDPAVYPHKSEIAHRFDVSLRMVPMHAVGDFSRVAIPGAMAQGLQELYMRDAKKQTDSAIEAAQERIVAALSRMVTQLDKVVDEQKPRLYKTLLTNTKTVADLAAALGPVSPELKNFSMQINNEILLNGQRKVEDFKDNVALSRDVADKARDIVQQIQPVSDETEEKVDDVVEETITGTGVSDSCSGEVEATLDFDEEGIFDVG